MTNNLYSIDAERSVIGALILEPEAWDKVSDIVVANDFFRIEHQNIFNAITSINDHGEPCDIVTIGEWLQKNSMFDQVLNMSYLVQIARDTPSSANVKTYADIVKERAVLRSISRFAAEVNDQTIDREGMASSDIINNAESLLNQIGDSSAKKSEYRTAGSVLNTAVDRIEELHNSGSKITGISTGFDDLDEMTLGLQRQDLMILAGRPSMGKTTLAMNIAEHVAINEDLPVAVFSVEMPAEQLMFRSISSIGRIDQTLVRTGKLDGHWDKLILATNQLKNSKMLIDDTSGISPAELRSKARKMARDHGQLGLILIDYLQLMQIPGYKQGRVNEISEISRSLKALAKEMNCPVIALSQLNRSLENRPNKRPINSDLRESGAIEQDADIITFVYRDEVYHDDSQDKGVAEIIIGKNRNGPVGTCRTSFVGRYSRFENLTADSYRDSQGY